MSQIQVGHDCPGKFVDMKEQDQTAKYTENKHSAFLYWRTLTLALIFATSHRHDLRSIIFLSQSNQAKFLPT